jgi:CheY-like chemotaxis protein
VTTPSTYSVACYNCKMSFDAMESGWCSCLVSERSLVCPSCLQCFCKAPTSYKSRFWSGAPKELWDRKFSEHHEQFTPQLNPDPADAARPLVLVVDDEPDIQRVASRVIESLGYGLVLARDGEQGLELAKRYKPDLVITDALMPRLDGREMGRRIKDDPETKDAKVVVMTALYTNQRYKNEGLKAYRVDDYLAKPITFDDLRKLLTKYLG